MADESDLVSVIQWISVDDALPPLCHNVIVCSSDGVQQGMRAIVGVMDRGENGLFHYNGRMEIEWGYEENGFEYWHKLYVTHWAEFPEEPHT